MFRLPHLIKVQPTEHCKNNVPYLVPPIAPLKGATHGTPQNTVPYLVPPTAPLKGATHGTLQK